MHLKVKNTGDKFPVTYICFPEYLWRWRQTFMWEIQIACVNIFTITPHDEFRDLNENLTYKYSWSPELDKSNENWLMLELAQQKLVDSTASKFDPLLCDLI